MVRSHPSCRCIEVSHTGAPAVYSLLTRLWDPFNHSIPAEMPTVRAFIPHGWLCLSFWLSNFPAYTGTIRPTLGLYSDL